MASSSENFEKGGYGMSEISLKVNKEDAEKIAECIKNIAGGISAGEIAEIVLRSPEKKMEPEKYGQPTISSKEVAEIFHCGHSAIFKKISKYICGYAKEEDKTEFRLSSFKIPQGQTYPMYELTKKACELFLEHVQTWKNYKSIAMGVDKMRRVMASRFGMDKKNMEQQEKKGSFLLEGRPREEYEAICRMFNDFITGPGIEGREITELTEKYEQFYKVMKQAQTNTKDNQEIEQAVFDVAIEAEMQGFIYGFKLFDAMLSKSLIAA